jgi:hypothetical protein
MHSNCTSTNRNALISLVGSLIGIQETGLFPKGKTKRFVFAKTNAASVAKRLWNEHGFGYSRNIALFYAPSGNGASLPARIEAFGVAGLD